jgi:cytoskeletal protein CcmA (bactofilin family)
MVEQKDSLMFANRKSDGHHMSSFGNEAERSAAPATARAAPGATYRSGPSAHSMVDEFLTMKGDLESEGDIHVKGKVLGNIRCKLLIVEVDAFVEGGVEAEEVIVRGNAKGTILADRVRLERTANVDSEIRHNSFSAEEGARIKGSLRSKEDPAGESSTSTVSPRQRAGRVTEESVRTAETSKPDAA